MHNIPNLLNLKKIMEFSKFKSECLLFYRKFKVLKFKIDK